MPSASAPRSATARTRASGSRASSLPACTRPCLESRRNRAARPRSAGSTQNANAVRSSAGVPAAIGTEEARRRRRRPAQGTSAGQMSDDQRRPRIVPPLVLPLPPNAPRVKPNAFIRWIGRTVLRLGGWRMEGEFPDIPKLVLIGAPHSSNWDGVWGFAAELALGLDIKILGKHQLFWSPLGALLRRLGVIDVARDAAHVVV